MLKSLLLATVLLLTFAGCTQQTTMTKKADMKPRMMFQTVDEKDAVLVQTGNEKYYCHICGMHLVKFYKTSYMAEDGTRKYQYCSIHCLADHLNHDVELKNPQVIDVSSLKPISVLQAYYVVGSDVRGTMSRVSKYAFGTYEAAQNFQKQHGGKIMDFNGALQEAQKDFN
ncbi:nitrous oxide reductase accessory protein NosL [Sulfurimonas sp. C5]|uniref:nitrous oxide reductase accessory protein NosL n=1 Tax=Sulfurimonas sp. C5 TaxID=3036947 RepID=UPI002454F79D|nr:nitrous oxide reductase accessory protein NosL [Sulfurimonas sp. C5]MDH4945114.1 nitrous oxide reductase accessory protein NosL [Sulfurimonas sp. C5]